MGEFFPINLRLAGRPCVVIGGGHVALRKARALAAAGADLVVVSPRFLKGFSRLPAPRLLRVPFVPEHLRGAFLVVAASSSGKLNARVAAEARRRGAMVNVVDRPSLCDFTLPAVVRRGDLLLAISTGGTSPALSRKLRLVLSRQFGSEYSQLLRLLKEMRAKAKERIPGAEPRRKALRRLVEDDVLRLLKRSGAAAARDRMLRIIKSARRAHQGAAPRGLARQRKT